MNGERSCSPRTRGWTAVSIPRRAANQVFPAYAGVDRCGHAAGVIELRVPRVRGGGPLRGRLVFA